MRARPSFRHAAIAAQLAFCVALVRPGRGADPVAEMNRGVSLLDAYRYSEAFDIFDSLAKRHPRWEAAHVNRGLAALNLQGSHLEAAEVAFGKALELNPGCIPALLMRGILYYHTARIPLMHADLEKAVALDPSDPYLQFWLGVAAIDSKEVPAARRAFEECLRLQPSFASALYRLREVYLALGERQRIIEPLRTYQKLQAGLVAIISGLVYGEGGKHSVAVRGTAPPGWAPTPRSPLPQRPLLEGPALPIASPPIAARRPDGIACAPSFALGDLTGDGRLEWVLCSQPAGDGGGPGGATQGEVVILERGDDGYRPRQRFANSAPVVAIGDLDSDGDADLVLAATGVLDLYSNDGAGTLAPLDLKAMDAHHDGFPVRIACADIDSDWDLDVLCLRWGTNPAGVGSSRIEALSNNRDGTYRDIAVPSGLEPVEGRVVDWIIDDLDGDVDLDLALLVDSPPRLVIYRNDRLWQMRRMEPPIEAPGLDAAVSAASGDLDGDADLDIAVFGGSGVRILENQGGLRFRSGEASGDGAQPLVGGAGLCADLAGALAPGLLIFGARDSEGALCPVYRARSASALPTPVEALRGVGPLAAAAFSLPGPGDAPALFVYDASRGAIVVTAPASARWLALDLAGPRKPTFVFDKERANVGGVGAVVEARAGLEKTYLRASPASGGAGHGGTRLLTGLGEAAAVDYVRVLWPDGVMQSEVSLAGGGIHRIEEAQRKPSSCPILFAWTADGWRFVGDFLGVGGLGYLEGPSSYSRPDPTEWLPLPALEARDGRLLLEVVEPLEECAYLDHIALTVVDHPAEVTVLPEELFAINAPAPGFRLLAFRRRFAPVAAWSALAREGPGALPGQGDGASVAGRLAEVDRRYAAQVEEDPRFPGIAREPEQLVLDFADGLETVAFGRGSEARPFLFLHGFIEYPYSTSNFAAWQAGVAARAPTISVERGGEWIPLRREWGFPAGTPRIMAVDLGGLLARGDRRLRVDTSLVIQWDQAFVADASEGASLQVEDLAPDVASLSFIGFPREESPDGELPLVYAHDAPAPSAPFKALAGSFTRYGDVRELLEAADDRFVILGPGDGIRLQLREDRVAPLPPGMKRTFLLKTVGYCKDMDLYTAHPDGVEPLPFQAMSAYPYGAREAYPSGPIHQRYLREWNTREVRPDRIILDLKGR